MSIKKEQGVFQPDMDLQDGCFLFFFWGGGGVTLSLRLSD